jgi:hypothetical protein
MDVSIASVHTLAPTLSFRSNPVVSLQPFTEKYGRYEAKESQKLPQRVFPRRAVPRLHRPYGAKACYSTEPSGLSDGVSEVTAGRRCATARGHLWTEPLDMAVSESVIGTVGMADVTRTDRPGTQISAPSAAIEGVAGISRAVIAQHDDIRREIKAGFFHPAQSRVIKEIHCAALIEGGGIGVGIARNSMRFAWTLVIPRNR